MDKQHFNDIIKDIQHICITRIYTQFDQTGQKYIIRIMLPPEQESRTPQELAEQLGSDAWNNLSLQMRGHLAAFGLPKAPLKSSDFHPNQWDGLTPQMKARIKSLSSME